MKNNERILRIHRYLQGEMEPTEQKVFEQEMDQDHTLRKEVDLEKKLLAGIKLTGDHQLRNIIQSVDQNLNAKGFFQRDNIVSIQSQTKRFSMKKIIALAAAAVILLGVAWWSFFNQDHSATSNREAAIAQYFNPEKASPNNIITNLERYGFADSTYNAQDSLREALVLYEAGDYDEARNALDTFLVNHPANDTAQFYLGMSHLNATRYAKAINVLGPLSVMENSAFQLTSKWYLGLCYLQMETGLEKAKEIFAELADNPEYDDRQSASGLLRMIDR